MNEIANLPASELKSTIGRTVAFVLTPILTPVLGALAFWLQDKLGINMDPTVAVGYVVSVIAAVGVVIAMWLRNRGHYELGLIEAHLLGQNAQQEAAPKALVSAGSTGQDAPVPASSALGTKSRS